MVQAVSRGKDDKGKSAPSAASYFVQKEAGESIFEAGDQGEEMFVIEDGLVEIVVEGNILKTLERGDFFGEMSILEDMPRSTAARAGAPGCKLLKIDRSMFAEVLRHNPEIAIRIMRGLSHRLRSATTAKREEIKPVAVAVEGRALAKLITEAGVEFDVYPKGETTIGRLDPSTGLKPDIDLRDVDTDRSISRRHAKIIGDGSTYVVVEEVGTSNGTFVNGNRLATGQKVAVSDGDEVVFGRLKTTFRVS
jgi:CRP-like cAMP-binding protein